MDRSPAQAYATLLDDNKYLLVLGTHEYRILEGASEARERRQQLTHPGYEKPQLLATRPNEVWSWDIERHEALWNRAVMKGHRHRLVAASRPKLRAA